MSSATRQRRTERAGALAKMFSQKRAIERLVWQDEKDFTLDIPMNIQKQPTYVNNKTLDLYPL